MLIAAITSALLLTDIRGGLCDFSLQGTPRRVYAIENGIATRCETTSLDSMEHPDPNGPQRAFLVQPRNTTLDHEGFRTTLSPFAAETVVVAQISATVPDQTTVNVSTVDPRYYTNLSGSREEILISVSGGANPQLIFSYGFGGGIVAGKTQIHNLAPLDISDGVLELDSRLSYNLPIDRSANLVTVKVCAGRGIGNCYVYAPSTMFGSSTPEFNLGSTMPPALPQLRARYCNLPSMATPNGMAGFTETCPPSDQGSTIGTGTF